MEHRACTLPGGIRLVHQRVHGSVAHLGLFIRAGSRDETDAEHGIAHFIEHTIFKGTQKRNLFQVLNRLENVGADLNAFTSKEETVIHASFLATHLDRAMELFQDVFFRATFPEKELVKEKQVVADEIRSYLDTPAEQIFDDFEDLLYQGHPLGHSILGTTKSLKRFGQRQVLDFIRRNYQPSRVVIVVSGNFPFERAERLALRYFSTAGGEQETYDRTPFAASPPFKITKRKKTAQVHCLAGTTAYPYTHPDRIVLSLLNNILGGPVMNSRLALALRERNGLTYHCESNYTAYSDTGLLGIYFGTDPALFDKALGIVLKELRRLREERLSTMKLHLVKKQISGQLAIARESNLATLLAIGRSYLIRDSFEPIPAVLKRIAAITADDLLRVANEILEESRLSYLTFTP